MIEERMDLGIAKRLIEDLIDLKRRIEDERDSIYFVRNRMKNKNDPCETYTVSEQLDTCEKVKEIYENLTVTIYKKLHFMIEAEINYLQCK